MYIYAFSNITQIVEESLSDKKSQLTKKFNRSDNFINLTLLGVQQCLKERRIAKETSLYIASNNGNMNTTITVLSAIFLEKRLPMPFNFLNTVNSVNLFYVAKNFGLDGKTLFVDRFESALPQAYVDIRNGKTVIVGVVTEAIADVELHKKKFKTNKIIESSRWLLLTPNKLEKESAIGKIENFRLSHSPARSSSISELFSFLESDERSFEYRGEGVSFGVEKL